MAKKKAGKGAQQRLSPEQYIKQKARTLPIDKCYITRGGLDVGLAHVLVTRLRPSGNRVMGMYLVDTYCLGVKDAASHANISPEEWEANAERLGLDYRFEEIPYAEAHNLIYGAIEFAEEAGLRPHHDFALAQYILEDDDNEEIPFIDYEFGRDGKYVLIGYPGDDLSRQIATLERNLEPDQYEIVEAGEESFIRKMKNEDAPEEPFHYDYPVYPEAVTLLHPELEGMLAATYAKSQLPKEVLEHIASLPREEIAADLNSLILREIGRVHSALAEGDEPEQLTDLLIHSVILLSRFGGKEAWPAVKELLHQPFNFQELAFGDLFDEIVPDAVVACSEGNLRVIKELLWASGLNLFARETLLTALWIIAHRNPERREEVVEFTREILESLFTRVPALNGADCHFAAFAIAMVTRLDARELLPIVERLYQAELIDESIMGPYEEFVESFGYDAIDKYDMIVEDRYRRMAEMYCAEAGDFQF